MTERLRRHALIAALASTILAGCVRIGVRNPLIGSIYDVGCSQSGGGTDHYEPLPSFPWEPPPPSTFLRIPVGRLAGFTDPLSLGAVARGIARSLESAKYTDYTFFAAPRGFAIVTRTERIDQNGKPQAANRFLSQGSYEGFSLVKWVKALFFEPSGYFRLMVFLVTDANFVPRGRPLDVQAASSLSSQGAIGLPTSYDSQIVTGDYQLVVLIYQFCNGPCAVNDGAVQVWGGNANQHLVNTQLTLEATEPGVR